MPLSRPGDVGSRIHYRVQPIRIKYSANCRTGAVVGHVDRILKRQKPADVPAQARTKYELVINLKACKAISLDVPAHVLAHADEVIE